MIAPGLSTPMNNKAPITLPKFTTGLAVAALLAFCCSWKNPVSLSAKNSTPYTDHSSAQIVGQWPNIIAGRNTERI
jgi:hypothetical protein